ncbi:MAG TPA: GGDEF domain-containing protein, partial [Thermoanaerobaculia bacterium]|nr:GGDEF domain-containing protein [Thermoanaerobaculia bacterium]
MSRRWAAVCLFVPEGFDRILAGRLERRPDAEEEADGGRDAEAEEDRPERRGRLEVEGEADQEGGPEAEGDPERAAEERIVRLAYYDNVTGLPNRAFLQEHLVRALEQSVRRNRKVAVLSLDLDGFKRVNDTLGHASGDILLKEVSKRLAGCLRNGDRVVRADTVRLDTSDNAGDALGRFGGDEFVVILADIRRTEHASEVAGRILRSLTPPFTINDQEVFVTGSVGIAISGADGDDAETLIKNADAAMYHAKEAGRNSFHLFTESVH